LAPSLPVRQPNVLTQHVWGDEGKAVGFPRLTALLCAAPRARQPKNVIGPTTRITWEDRSGIVGPTAPTMPCAHAAPYGGKAKPSVFDGPSGFAVCELLYSAAAFKTSAPSLRK
jgi:hypothetical protein